MRIGDYLFLCRHEVGQIGTEKVARRAPCGTAMECARGADCWCMRVPFRPMQEAPTGCLCPKCLEKDHPSPSEA